ncbi:MAG: signal peptidase I [Candidatus Omnitrophota bacterium]|nr:MAG: signal peptidase I [Candidatus Omnitrophota bacterium]
MGKKKFIWGLVILGIVSIAMVIIGRTIFVTFYRVPTTAMEPTIPNGSKIWVRRAFYDLQRGDVVVFVSPTEGKKKLFVKRLVGLPGEAIEIRDGNIIADDKIVVEPSIVKVYYYNIGEYAKVGKKIYIAKKHYYALGDNSKMSLDSRFFGPVHEKSIKGKAIFIITPDGKLNNIE